MSAVSRLLRRLWAFVVRDVREETSYRFALVLQLFGLAWVLVVFWYGARLVDPNLPQLARYGGNWFSYVVLGYAPLEFLRVGVFGFSSSVREAQSHGTLEALLVTRAGIPTIVFGSVAYGYLRATVRALLFVAVGLAAAGTTTRMDFGAAAAFLALSITCFGAIGVLSASFVMVFKRGDPVSILVVGTSTLFAGLFFPPALLGRLEIVSRFLPLTYAMEGVRLAAQGSSLVDLWPDLSMLALFCAVLVPVAAWSFRAAIDRARRDGTLGQY